MRIRTSILAPIAALTLGLVAAGCSKPPPYPACESDDHCKEKNEFCVNKSCQQCRDDADCEAGEMCANGRCEEKPECMTDGDCSDGKVCRLDKCVEVECTSDEDCPEGKTCENDSCVEPVGGCSSDYDCGAGMKCEDGQCVTGGSNVSGACIPDGSGGAGEVVKLITVNFDFNEANLRVDARGDLEQNAECLKQAPNLEVVLEGHADERGTQEYNLALSERRADAVLNYLRNLGIDTSRLRIVPKGKNEPVCRAATEACFARNRRVEFIQKRSNGF